MATSLKKTSNRFDPKTNHPTFAKQKKIMEKNTAGCANSLVGFSIVLDASRTIVIRANALGDRENLGDDVKGDLSKYHLSR